MSYGIIPKEEIELFKQLPNMKVIIDVGARDDTEYYDIYPEAEHHLFEPNLEFIANLKHKLAGKSNVQINPVGVSDIEDMGRYSRSVQAFVGGEARVVDPIDTYPLINLDRYVLEHDITRIDFLKVDVEGYDYKVLFGAPKAVHMSRFIQYEHWDNKKQYHALLGEAFDMEYVGYRNVLCMNKELVDVRDRNKIREYIADNKLAQLA